jgi:cytochrome P450
LPRNNLGLFLPRAITRRAWWNVAARPGYRRLDRIRELLSAHITRTRDDPDLEHRNDVLSLLVHACDDGAQLTDGELRDDLVTLVTAGHETTATAIAWGCDLLANNPGVARRLRDTLASGDRDYLKATVKEVLRARSILYVSVARHSLEPFRIGNWVLGPDVLILVDAQGIHGDPHLYPEPDAFRPERFLERSPDGYSYIPFGGGAHRCLGAPLATLELELFLESVAQNVILSPAGPPARPTRRGVTLAPGNRGRVRVDVPPTPVQNRPPPTVAQPAGASS